MRFHHGRGAGLLAIAAVALTQQAAPAASGSWTIVQSPNPPASTATLASVSCPAATSCFAVGDAFAHGRDRPLAEHWDGSAWSVMPTSGLAAGGGLDSVSCVSPQSCMAVGDRSPIGGGPVQTQTARWNGAAWLPIPSPTPGQGATLTGVSCAAASTCFAVGGSISTSGAQLTLIEHWNGRQWAISPSPNPSGTTSALQAVSCPTLSGCFAGGEYAPTRATVRTLTERWTGSSWSIVSSPNVRSSQVNKLNGVSCTSMSACEAVGEGSLTLAERWNGTSWSIVASANPATGGDSLMGVSCSNATTCVAVGAYALDSGALASLIEEFGGAGWTLVNHPNPKPSKGAVLSGVDCTTTCVAVGDNSPSVWKQQTLVEQRLAG